jgi:hypothetical protein
MVLMLNVEAIRSLRRGEAATLVKRYRKRRKDEVAERETCVAEKRRDTPFFFSLISHLEC